MDTAKEKNVPPLRGWLFLLYYGYGAYNKTKDFNELTCGERSLP